MKWRILRNDLKRNKMINGTLLLFIIFSAALAVLAVLMSVQTFSSIKNFYEVSNPPHFVQMHKGDVDTEKLNDFIQDYPGVTNWQLVAMIDLYGDEITIVKDRATFSLEDCRLDLGFVKQNGKQDLLLDQNHGRVVLEKGEVGIPVILQRMYDIELGDRVIVASNGVEMTFVVKTFVLDGMMNSSMASSTRVLISDEDYDNLIGTVGETEYLIEAFFTDTKISTDFQTDYENAGLPKNGQAVTYSMIFMLSAITDLITGFVLLIVSGFMMIVSFLCIKFTILAVLEEEIGEVGTLKALGFKVKDIVDIYIVKFRTISILGTLIGVVIAFTTRNIFTGRINQTFGNSALSGLSVGGSLLVAVVFILLVDLYCRRIIKKISKVSVVDALVKRVGIGKRPRRVRSGLHRSKMPSVNWVIGLREIGFKFRNYIIIFVVVTIGFIMIQVPVNLLNTFESPKFITYMGSSNEDILVEVENGNYLEENYSKALGLIDSNSEVESFFIYRGVSVESRSKGDTYNLHIDTGNHAGNELQYLSGVSPEGDFEIAMSYLNAEKTGKNSGDSIALKTKNGFEDFYISGIYQDVTSGGFTSKSKNPFDGIPSEKYTITVNLFDSEKASEIAALWSAELGSGVSVDDMEAFIDQTLGGVASQLRFIVMLVTVMSLSLIALITIMFLKLRLAKDLSDIAIVKAIGFTEYDIRQQYLVKVGLVSMIGALTGILLSIILGENLVNGALGLANIGISKVTLVINNGFQYVLNPLMIVGTTLVVSRYSLSTVDRFSITHIVNE